MPTQVLLAIGLTTALTCGQGLAQSLFERPGPVEASGENQPVQGPPPLAVTATSLYFIEPPQPRIFQAEDLVTIIISERTRLDRFQGLDTEKKFTQQAAIDEFIDLMKLLELRIEDSRLSSEDLGIELGYDAQFESDGEYGREDQLTARVTARVVEVKPNGTLLLESRTVITTDNEEQVILLSGYCRPEDITDRNTVQSNQMYDLNLNIQHNGELDKAASKGLVTKALETIFNF